MAWYLVKHRVSTFTFYHIKTFNGISVAPTSKVYTTLHLPDRLKKHKCRVASSSMMSVPSSLKIHPQVCKGGGYMMINSSFIGT